MTVDEAAVGAPGELFVSDFDLSRGWGILDLREFVADGSWWLRPARASDGDEEEQDRDSHSSG